MPEPRARTYHRNRVAHSFSEEIGAMLEGELSDPRIFPSVVTEVVLAPGGKSARVFVAVHGAAEEEASTLAALTQARGFIRASIRERMGVRHVPELSFAIDRSEKMTGRMDELLGRMRKREKKRDEKAAAAHAPEVAGSAQTTNQTGNQTGNQAANQAANQAPSTTEPGTRPAAAEPNSTKIEPGR